VAIRFFSDRISFQLKQKQKLSKWLKKVVADEGKKMGHLCYVFVSDKTMLKLNRQYLQHDYFTDIITFDNVSKNTISGEMYISIDTIRSNAEIYQTGFDHELWRVMVHGVLHLCGYNDKTEDEQLLMRATETKYLSLL
jgi:rRNA maturation RNase YbeY